jgi:hypothetical protein
LIGVSNGAPTEFHFLEKIIDGPFESARIDNAINQDDLYVEMTFARVMDTVGLDRTPRAGGDRTSRRQSGAR